MSNDVRTFHSVDKETDTIICYKVLFEHDKPISAYIKITVPEEWEAIDDGINMESE